MDFFRLKLTQKMAMEFIMDANQAHLMKAVSGDQATLLDPSKTSGLNPPVDSIRQDHYSG